MMKKLFFTFFLIFTLFLPLSAQVRLGNFSQKGVATQEMKDDGLVAAHSSLPLNTMLKIKNEANNKEVVVKVTNRISNSSSRVIDLSAAAFKALELKKDGVVTVSINAPTEVATATRATSTPRNGQSTAVQTPEVVVVQPSVAQQAVPVQTTTAPGTTVTSSQLPGINVVVTNSTPITAPTAPTYPPTPAYPAYPPAYSRSEPYNGDRIIVINTNPSPPAYPPPAYAPAPPPAPVATPAPAASSSQNNSAYLAWLMAMTVEAREARAAREEREIREAREAREVREMRIAREEREEREAREIREAREEREAREAREIRLAQLAREEREAREAREAMEEFY
jgi:hypothetical protein